MRLPDLSSYKAFVPGRGLPPLLLSRKTICHCIPLLQDLQQKVLESKHSTRDLRMGNDLVPRRKPARLKRRSTTIHDGDMNRKSADAPSEFSPVKCTIRSNSVSEYATTENDAISLESSKRSANLKYNEMKVASSTENTVQSSAVADTTDCKQDILSQINRKTRTLPVKDQQLVLNYARTLSEKYTSKGNLLITTGDSQTRCAENSFNNSQATTNDIMQSTLQEAFKTSNISANYFESKLDESGSVLQIIKHADAAGSNGKKDVVPYLDSKILDSSKDSYASKLYSRLKRAANLFARHITHSNVSQQNTPECIPFVLRDRPVNLKTLLTTVAARQDIESLETVQAALTSSDLRVLSNYALSTSRFWILVQLMRLTSPSELCSHIREKDIDDTVILTHLLSLHFSSRSEVADAVETAVDHIYGQKISAFRWHILRQIVKLSVQKTPESLILLVRKVEDLLKGGIVDQARCAIVYNYIIVEGISQYILLNGRGTNGRNTESLRRVAVAIMNIHIQIKRALEPQAQVALRKLFDSKLDTLAKFASLFSTAAGSQIVESSVQNHNLATAQIIAKINECTSARDLVQLAGKFNLISDRDRLKFWRRILNRSKEINSDSLNDDFLILVKIMDSDRKLTITEDIVCNQLEWARKDLSIAQKIFCNAIQSVNLQTTYRIWENFINILICHGKEAAVLGALEESALVLDNEERHEIPVRVIRDPRFWNSLLNRFLNHRSIQVFDLLKLVLEQDIEFDETLIASVANVCMVHNRAIRSIDDGDDCRRIVSNAIKRSIAQAKILTEQEQQRNSRLFDQTVNHAEKTEFLLPLARLLARSQQFEDFFQLLTELKGRNLLTPSFIGIAEYYIDKNADECVRMSSRKSLENALSMKWSQLQCLAKQSVPERMYDAMLNSIKLQ